MAWSESTFSETDYVIKIALARFVNDFDSTCAVRWQCILIFRCFVRSFFSLCSSIVCFCLYIFVCGFCFSSFRMHCAFLSVAFFLPRSLSLSFYLHVSIAEQWIFSAGDRHTTHIIWLDDKGIGDDSSHHRHTLYRTRC